MVGVGYGTMGVHDPSVIVTALESGYRIMDSARVYGNEVVVGQGIVDFLQKHPEVKLRRNFVHNQDP